VHFFPSTFFGKTERIAIEPRQEPLTLKERIFSFIFGHLLLKKKRLKKRAKWQQN